MDQMEELKQLSVEAHEQLSKQDAKQWCKAFFSDMCKCDISTNNLSETFNGWIVAARQKPIIEMLEDMREHIMERLVRNKTMMLRSDDVLPPRIRKKLEDAKNDSFLYEAKWDGFEGYEVKRDGGLEGRTVSLVNRTCACRAWDLDGIPCRHAVAAIYEQREEPEEYVSAMLKRDAYLASYQFPLRGINGPDLWEPSGKEKLLSPKLKVLPGRPKKRRIRDLHEEHKIGASGRLSKKGILMTCRRCNQIGHNMRTCKNPAVQKLQKEKGK